MIHSQRKRCDDKQSAGREPINCGVNFRNDQGEKKLKINSYRAAISSKIGEFREHEKEGFQPIFNSIFYFCFSDVVVTLTDKRYMTCSKGRRGGGATSEMYKTTRQRKREGGGVTVHPLPRPPS